MGTGTGTRRRKLQEYTFVDLCSGAGGPTGEVERVVNELLLAGGGGGDGAEAEAEGVEFVLTDLHPHLAAWREVVGGGRGHLHYVPEPVDAADVPGDLLQRVVPPLPSSSIAPPLPSSSSSTLRHRPSPPTAHPNPNPNPNPKPNTRQFRLFSLSFHHFPTPLASLILSHALRTSSGFLILELQTRSVESILMVLFLVGPALWLGSWYWFWRRWGLLFWIYVLPVVPVVVVFDGVVSCLRTRTEGEVRGLVEEVRRRRRDDGGKEGKKIEEGWRFESGVESHTWPVGEMSWFFGVREDGDEEWVGCAE